MWLFPPARSSLAPFQNMVFLFWPVLGFVFSMDVGGIGGGGGGVIIYEGAIGNAAWFAKEGGLRFFGARWKFKKKC